MASPYYVRRKTAAETMDGFSSSELEDAGTTLLKKNGFDSNGRPVGQVHEDLYELGARSQAHLFFGRQLSMN